jgi:hypothetical protein
MAEHTRDISDWEFGRVSQLASRERYAYTINRVREYGSIWLLVSDDGWCMAHNPQGEIALAIWPAEEFALECATGEWASARPDAVPVGDFLSRINEDVRV